MDFYNTIEQTLVNGDVPSRYGVNYSMKTDEEYKDKKYKADYMNLQVKLVDHLKYLSIKLKSLNLPDRP